MPQKPPARVLRSARAPTTKPASNRCVGITGCAEHDRARLVGRRQPESDELHAHTCEQQGERQSHKRTAEQSSRLLADDRLNRRHGQERQSDACAEDRHDVELRAKSTSAEHGLGARRQHLAQHADE